jgi:hypothetical protein
VRSY